jgi:hypothetical protein
MSNFFPKRVLTASELSIAFEAFFQLLLQRIKVSFLPSRKYLPSISKNSAIFLSLEKTEIAKKVAIVINGLSIRTPWSSTCLVKVLAAHKMLNKRRIPHALHFGVNINLSKGFNAHAWLSVADEVIIGGENLNSFKEISRITI